MSVAQDVADIRRELVSIRTLLTNLIRAVERQTVEARTTKEPKCQDEKE